MKFGLIYELQQQKLWARRQAGSVGVSPTFFSRAEWGHERRPQ
jgi:hypothetical protein